MPYRIAADATLLLHLSFIAFATFGALLVPKWQRLAWLQLPAAAWGLWIELTGAFCPLTYLENALRRRAGEQGYGEGFIAHYLLPLIYPAGLTRGIQLWLGGLVLLANLVIYGWLLLRWRHRATRGAR